MTRIDQYPYEEEYIWECYNSLLLSHDTERIRKLLVRYELFKMSIEVPGDIVECGVFKGTGLMYWLKLLSIYASGSKKQVIGFDTFKSFAHSIETYEKKSVDTYVEEAEFSGIDPNSILQRATLAGFEKKVELVEGDIQISAKEYVKNNIGFRISLMHLDLDTYAGTKAALEILYPYVSRSGLIVIDEYGCRGWGESDAVDEYFEDKNVKIKTVPFSATPTAYIIKKN